MKKIRKNWTYAASQSFFSPFNIIIKKGFVQLFSVCCSLGNFDVQKRPLLATDGAALCLHVNSNHIYDRPNVWFYGHSKLNLLLIQEWKNTFIILHLILLCVTSTSEAAQKNNISWLYLTRPVDIQNWGHPFSKIMYYSKFSCAILVFFFFYIFRIPTWSSF